MLSSHVHDSYLFSSQTVCHSSTTFIAHLVNQGVADVVIVLEILLLLLERPTDDSIEIAVGLTREVGAYIQEESPMATNTVFERFRAVLNEGTISHRVQYMIEVLMQVRKDKYKDNPIIPEGLDLVEAEEQIPHQIQLQDDLAVQEGLSKFKPSLPSPNLTFFPDIFKADPNFLDNEEKYKAIKSEILGEGSDDSDDSGSDESDDEADERESIPLCTHHIVP
jgi:pre-mRNA-splicing factor CWC22